MEIIAVGTTIQPFLLGVNGIWLAMPVGELLTLFVFIYLIRKSVKKMSVYPGNRGIFSKAA